MSSGEGAAFGIDHIAPIQVAPCQAQHQHLRRGDVAGKGDVVFVAQPGDIGNVIGHALAVGVGEEQHQVELIVGDAGADLLAAAMGVGQEAVHVQAGGVGHHVSGGVGGIDLPDFSQNRGFFGEVVGKGLFCLCFRSTFASSKKQDNAEMVWCS